MPEIRLLCGLRFGGVLSRAEPEHREAYLREFLPALAEAAARCDRAEFLPEELEALRRLVELLESEGELKGSREVEALAGLLRPAARMQPADGGRPGSGDGRAVRVNGLFVEYYPDLDLAPRGRLLTLRVAAMALPGGAKDDDVVVRNPVSDPDDRFLAQARDSVAAARRHLAKRYGWNSKKRYRFDFAVESAGARFTGDSLGVAFAVGAVAALGRIEALRDEIGVNPAVAFCGAMAAHGVLAPVDVDALKLKVCRGFWSDLKVLVIPRDHLLEAWSYLKELEEAHPGRKLELMGADSLDDVAGDPRLVPARRRAMASLLVRKAWHAKHSVWVLCSLLALFTYLVASLLYPPLWIAHDTTPSVVRMASRGFDVLNAEGEVLWSQRFESVLDTASSLRQIGDLTGDGEPEVAFMPRALSDDFGAKNQVLVFRNDGTILFQQTCTIDSQYPGENCSAIFTPSSLAIIDTGAGSVLLTSLVCSDPARTHIRIWSGSGNPVAWYINSGFSTFRFAKDWIGDSSPELFFVGINNRIEHKSACLFTLPITQARGVSPPYQSDALDLSAVERGNQSSYMVFPKTDMCVLAGKPYNTSSALEIEAAGRIRLDVNEWSDPVCGIRYFLDSQLHVVEINADDYFVFNREKQVLQGRIPPVVSWPEYFDRQRLSVAYWSDSGWVAEAERQFEQGHP